MAAYLLIAVIAASLLGAGDRASSPWESIYDQAIQLYNHAEFESSRSIADSGYRRWCTQPQSHACWSFRLALAESLIELARPKEALPLLDIDARSPEDEARRLSDLSLVYFSDADLAPQFLAEARSHLPPGDRDLLGKIDLIQGTLEMKKEQMAEAEGSFRRALAAVEGSHSLMESYTLSDLGLVDLQRFRYDEALYWFGRARDMARESGLRRALDLALGDLGATYRALGDLDRAITTLNNAAGLAEELHDRVYQMRWLVVLGETWSDRGDLTKAEECYQKARSLGDPERDKKWLANILDDLSQIALKKGDLASAEDLNLQGTAMAQPLGSLELLLTHEIQTAAIAAARRDYSKAEKIFTNALADSRKVGDGVATFRCHAGLASLYQEMGSASREEQEYRTASDVIDDLHSRLRQDESKFSFISSLVDFYRNYVAFLFERGDDDGAFRVSQSCRARVLEEKLNQEGRGDPTGDLQSLQQKARASGSILLSYWLAPKQSRLWVITPDMHQSFPLPGEEEIARHVRQYNDAIQRRENPIDSGNADGQWLFSNLLAAHYSVPKDAKVVIEPDGALHQLNFESLPAGDGKHYWIEDATVSIAPSLELLRPAEFVPPRRLLIFGDPQYEGTEFQRLPNVKAEMEAVEKHFPEKEIYDSSHATAAAYQASHPENYSTIHFATHAVPNRESPLDSAIVLSGPAASRKLYAREIRQHSITADLVTLSACQSAGSRTYYGEGLTGFSWAFLSAGARNVVAGLWDVSDQATANLMKDFYTQLASGLPPASALRSAKRKMIAQGTASRRPLYWAAFETFTKALYP